MRKFAFPEEYQTPYQANDNFTKADWWSCGPFVLFMIRYLPEHIFESNGQLDSNLQVRLPSGLRLTFNSISERAKIIRLQVSRRVKIEHDEQDGKD